MPLRKRPQSNKVTGLPTGVTRTTRKYSDKRRRPHEEFQVYYKNEKGDRKIKHFYVPHDANEMTVLEVMARAIAFRLAYEERVQKQETRSSREQPPFTPH